MGRLAHELMHERDSAGNFAFDITLAFSSAYNLVGINE